MYCHLRVDDPLRIYCHRRVIFTLYTRIVISLSRNAVRGQMLDGVRQHLGLLRRGQHQLEESPHAVDQARTGHLTGRGPPNDVVTRNIYFDKFWLHPHK